MVDKPRFDGTTGKPAYKAATSKPAYCDKACDECGHCSNLGDCTPNEPGCPDADCCTPSRYEIVISGVTLAPIGTCIDCGTKSIKPDAHPDINGTFLLSQYSIDPCWWIYNYVGESLWFDYDDADDCTGTETERNTDVRIILSYAAGPQVFLDIVAKDADDDMSYFDDFFSVSGERCDEVHSFTNDWTAHSCNDTPKISSIRLGHGGTATATPCP